MYDIDALFKDEHQVALLHDAVLEATDKSLSAESLRVVWDKAIPEVIQLNALTWGFSDTVFRDAVSEQLMAIGLPKELSDG